MDTFQPAGYKLKNGKLNSYCNQSYKRTNNRWFPSAPTEISDRNSIGVLVKLPPSSSSSYVDQEPGISKEFLCLETQIFNFKSSGVLLFQLKHECIALICRVISPVVGLFPMQFRLLINRFATRVELLWIILWNSPLLAVCR